jgi:hypothetical protein
MLGTKLLPLVLVSNILEFFHSSIFVYFILKVHRLVLILLPFHTVPLRVSTNVQNKWDNLHQKFMTTFSCVTVLNPESFDVKHWRPRQWHVVWQYSELFCCTSPWLEKCSTLMKRTRSLKTNVRPCKINCPEDFYVPQEDTMVYPKVSGLNR